MKTKKNYSWILVFFFLFSVCRQELEASASTKGEREMEIKITSSAFENGAMIPKKYTCDGEDVSPPLAWTSVPEGTQSLALICDDPDVPIGTWVHWVLFNLPPTAASVDENTPPLKPLENSAVHGMTDFRRLGYGGPCPPSGTHRYFFKLYALDTKLNLNSGATKEQLLKAMKGHILAEGQLVGKYKRSK